MILYKLSRFSLFNLHGILDFKPQRNEAIITCSINHIKHNMEAFGQHHYILHLTSSERLGLPYTLIKSRAEIVQSELSLEELLDTLNTRFNDVYKLNVLGEVVRLKIDQENHVKGFQIYSCLSNNLAYVVQTVEELNLIEAFEFKDDLSTIKCTYNAFGRLQEVNSPIDLPLTSKNYYESQISEWLIFEEHGSYFIQIESTTNGDILDYREVSVYEPFFKKFRSQKGSEEYCCKLTNGNIELTKRSTNGYIKQVVCRIDISKQLQQIVHAEAMPLKLTNRFFPEVNFYLPE